MRVYLAAPFETRVQALEVAEAIKSLGHEVTSRWLTDHDTDFDAMTADDCAREAIADFEDIWSARVLVMLNSGQFSRMSAGKHIELGYCLGIGNDAIVVGPDNHIFWHLPNVTRVDTIADALTLLEDPNRWL
jgi:hypothetical protein